MKKVFLIFYILLCLTLIFLIVVKEDNKNSYLFSDNSFSSLFNNINRISSLTKIITILSLIFFISSLYLGCYFNIQENNINYKKAEVVKLGKHAILRG